MDGLLFPVLGTRGGKGTAPEIHKALGSLLRPGAATERNTGLCDRFRGKSLLGAGTLNHAHSGRTHLQIAGRCRRHPPADRNADLHPRVGMPVCVLVDGEERHTFAAETYSTCVVSRYQVPTNGFLTYLRWIVRTQGEGAA